MKTSISVSLILLVGTTWIATPLYAETNAADALANDASSLVRDAATLISDSTITVAINTKIALDKNLSQYSIDVTTRNGNVTLTGQVNSAAEVNEIVHLAEATNGVKAVNAAKLTVIKSNQPLTDMAITTKIKGLFLKEKLLGEKDVPIMTINVETTNGIVFLSGSADTTAQAQNAIKLAQSVDGVSRVESSVIIMNK